MDHQHLYAIILWRRISTVGTPASFASCNWLSPHTWHDDPAAQHQRPRRSSVWKAVAGELTAPFGKVLSEDQGGSKSLTKDDTETSLFAVVKKSFHACALFIEGVRVGERSSGITCNRFDMYPSAKLQVAMKAAAKATKQQFWLQIGNMESHCHFICKFCSNAWILPSIMDNSTCRAVAASGGKTRL